jgi:sugar phosphate isomerase/epimerase
MSRKYSLVHLTDITCPPSKMIYIAADTGYDYVSLRTIPMNIPGEVPFDITKDKQLLYETKQALEETGILINDIENARIFDGVNIQTYEPSLEVAAELGVKNILTNIWTSDKTYYTEKLDELCEIAATYNQTINVEFVTWASVNDIQTTKELLHQVGSNNCGMVIDVLHFHRSKCSFEDINSVPKEWLNMVHLCDAGKKIPQNNDDLVHTGRAERLYPGEGAIDINRIMANISPYVICGIEVPHLKRVQRLGYKEHAKNALQRTKEYFQKESLEVE